MSRVPELIRQKWLRFVVVGLVLVLSIRQVSLYFMMSTAAAAVDRRELSTAMQLLSRCRSSWWYADETALLTARCAAIPGDWDDADREFRSVSATPGRRVELERALLRFRSGNTNDAAEWMLAGEEQLQDRQMLDLLEALVDGAIRSGDSELAQSFLVFMV